MSDQDQEKKPEDIISRRKFLNYCSNAVLITAAYQAISVFGQDDLIKNEPWGRCTWNCQWCKACNKATSLRG